VAHFTPLQSLIGGVLIGLAASLLLLFHGKVAGISGILGNLLSPAPGDVAWRVAFLAGLLVAGLGGALSSPASFAFEVERSLGAIVVAGLLVGFGTRLGNGCTSGHGVCGLSRLSGRSLVATITFMVTGVIMAAVGGMLPGR
jgi:uncharacterized membrane protein YedE/YeeE